jgi:ankyrin repeat protein
LNLALSQKDGETPLDLLMRHNQTNIINVTKLLINNGANPNIKDNQGQTTLHKVLMFNSNSTNINNKDN